MSHQRRLSLILNYVKMSHYKTSVRAASAQKIQLKNMPNLDLIKSEQGPRLAFLEKAEVNIIAETLVAFANTEGAPSSSG